jgi:hypothetical protein
MMERVTALCRTIQARMFVMNVMNVGDVTSSIISTIFCLHFRISKPASNALALETWLELNIHDIH